jgi:hypothetical protein
LQCALGLRALIVHPNERFRNGDAAFRGCPPPRSVDGILTAQSSFLEGVKIGFRSQYLAEEARVRFGSNASVRRCADHFRSSPMNRHYRHRSAGLKGAKTGLSARRSLPLVSGVDRMAKPFGSYPNSANVFSRHFAWRLCASHSCSLCRAAALWLGRLREPKYLADVRSQGLTKILGVGRERAAFVPESGPRLTQRSTPVHDANDARNQGSRVVSTRVLQQNRVKNGSHARLGPLPLCPR